MTEKEIGPNDVFKRPDGKIDVPSPNEKSAKEFVQKYEFAKDTFAERRELVKQSLDGTQAPKSEFQKRREALEQSQSQSDGRGEGRGEGGKTVERPELAPGAGVYVGARKSHSY